MKKEGPVLELLTRRLAACPPDFLLPPGTIDVVAIVSDVLRSLGGEGLDAQQAAEVEGLTRNHQQTMAVAGWLLHEPWFRAEPRELADLSWRWLKTGLLRRAELVPAEQWLQDPDRREELARYGLRALEFRPRGETQAQAEDRLKTLNSVERHRVVEEAKAAEKRAREIREAMARRAAEEAVAAYDRG